MSVSRKLITPLAMLIAMAGALTPTTAAHAATATVPNGLTTTDLSAVGMSPSSLAASLVGPGVTVSNVTYSGANAQAGTIHIVDPAVVSFNDGVIMSSGNIADVIGPNKSESTTGDMAGAGDTDLTALIANTQTVNPATYDAAVLAFDFVPSASQVYFTYTFGSDEYLEWVNLFNDVFAFYVNGQNCATTPGGQAVSIDTINSSVNANLYRDNSFISPPANPINIEPDGLSVEMICSAPVNAGQTNHMKLAIADTSDQILDSVVMLKAHSLSTTPPESCNNSIDDNGDNLVDDADPICQNTTTPPPPGSGGIGGGGSAPPFTGNEGTPIVLDASSQGWAATPDTVSTTWEVTGINGTPGTCTINPSGYQPLNGDGSIAVVTAVCPNEGEYVAHVWGWDSEGGSPFDNDVDFFVHNAPPAVAITAPLSGAQVATGVPLSLAADVSDPGVNDVLGCQINWGDGTSEAGALAAGACTGTHSYSAADSYVITVTATDDALDSSADKTVVVVGAAGTNTTVASNTNPSVTGQAVTFTGSTTAGTTGTMQFYDGTTLLSTKTVKNGAVTFATSTLTPGTHEITAAYQATPLSLPDVSAAVVQVVNPAATTLALTSSPNPSVTGQEMKVRGVVTPTAPGGGKPTGSLDLYDNSAFLITLPVTSGVAAVNLKPAAGSHSYTATYSGSGAYSGSATTGALNHQVNPAATTTVLTSNHNPSVFGQWVTLKATVRPAAPGSGTPAGTVDFYENGVLMLSQPLAHGYASMAVKPAVGTHNYTAVYSGSASYLTSNTAAALGQVVNVADAKITLSSSYPSTTIGHSGYLKATVSAVPPGTGRPTGSVTLSDNGVPFATLALVSGKVTVPLASFSVGVHNITASYTGDGNFAPATTAAPFVQTIL